MYRVYRKAEQLMLKKEQYLIKEAARLTGVSEQLIRQWEHRYKIITPERLSNGYRAYSFNDLLILKEIKVLRDQGYSIKNAIYKVLRQQEVNTDKFYFRAPSEYVEKLVVKGTVYDEEGLMYLLKKAHHEFGLDIFLENTVQPFLEKIGMLWAQQAWDESQEMISSLVVRDFLTQITRNFNNGSESPLALGACLPEEQHEIPLQILLLQMKVRGWRTTRIGASPKFESIETLIKNMQPQKVLLSATTTFPFEKDKYLFEKLDNLAEKYPHIEFYIGGRGVLTYTRIIKPKHMVIPFTIDDIVLES